MSDKAVLQHLLLKRENIHKSRVRVRIKSNSCKASIIIDVERNNSMTILRAQQEHIQNLVKEEQDWFVPGLEQQRHNIRFYDNKLPRKPGCAKGDR